MAIKEVQIFVSEVKNLLSQGYTWYKKDDLGYGSIQEKYEANDIQIATIRKDPNLKNLETTAVIFKVCNDVDNQEKIGEELLQQPIVRERKRRTPSSTNVNEIEQTVIQSSIFEEDDELSAFNNL